MPDRFFKAKKYVASKLAETRGGRSFILKNFGPAGVSIVSALKSSATTFKDAPTAKSLKKDLLKLVTKAVLLSQKTTLGDAREPSLACIQGIQEFLDGGPIPSFKAAHDALLALLKKHVREHNWRRLTRLTDFYGSPEFLRQLPQKERGMLRVAIAELMQPYESEMKALTEFLIRSLKRQEEELKGLIQNPQLTEYLKSDVGSDVLTKWLSPDLTPYLSFLRAVEYFKLTENLRLRGPRARQIKEKYFVLFDNTDECEAKLSKNTPPRDTFEKLEDVATRKLDAVFSADFTSSSAFTNLKAQAASLKARAQASQRHLAALDHHSEEESDDDTVDEEEDEIKG